MDYFDRHAPNIERLVSELMSNTIQSEAEDPAAHMLRLLQDRGAPASANQVELDASNEWTTAAWLGSLEASSST